RYPWQTDPGQLQARPARVPRYHTSAALCAGDLGGGVEHAAMLHTAAVTTRSSFLVLRVRVSIGSFFFLRSRALRVCYWPALASVSSTRRFCARPSAVSFEATGFASPKPWAEIRLGFTPCEIMYCMTVSARFCDRMRLEVTPSFIRPGP